MLDILYFLLSDMDTDLELEREEYWKTNLDTSV
jgi:hypothetical protein